MSVGNDAEGQSEWPEGVRTKVGGWFKSFVSEVGLLRGSWDGCRDKGLAVCTEVDAIVFMEPQRPTD